MGCWNLAPCTTARLLPGTGRGTPYNQGMKKRRVWWVVGGLIVAVALFVAVAYFVGDNPADARLERAVAEIVEEYGFEIQPQQPGHFASPSHVITYARAPVDTEIAEEIVALLRDACPMHKYVHVVLDENFLGVAAFGGDPWLKTHRFTPPTHDGGGTIEVFFIPDDHRSGIGDPPMSAILVLVESRPSLRQRIRGLWPW